MRNDCCTTLDTTLVQFQQLFFKLTIEYVFLHVGPKYPMVKVAQELDESWTKVVNVTYLLENRQSGKLNFKNFII